MRVPVSKPSPFDVYRPARFEQSGYGLVVSAVHPGYAGGLHAVDFALKAVDGTHQNVPLDPTTASPFLWSILHLTSYASNEARTIFEEDGGVEVDGTWYPCSVELDVLSTNEIVVLSHTVSRVCLKTSETLVSKATVTLPNRKLRRLVQDTRHAMLDLGAR